MPCFCLEGNLGCKCVHLHLHLPPVIVSAMFAERLYLWTLGSPKTVFEKIVLKLYLGKRCFPRKYDSVMLCRPLGLACAHTLIPSKMQEAIFCLHQYAYAAQIWMISIAGTPRQRHDCVALSIPATGAQAPCADPLSRCCFLLSSDQLETAIRHLRELPSLQDRT